MLNERIFIPTLDGALTIYRPDIDECYHSRKGALKESQYVFIQNGLDRCRSNELKVLEIGWGTGLNGLLSAEWAQKHGRKIFYHSLETHPLEISEYEQFAASIHVADELKTLWKKMRESGWEKDCFIHDFFTLHKENQSIQSVELLKESYDVIFFDAFAPSKQPEMWEPDILKKCYLSLKPAGLLTTYCAQGKFKRDLKDIGYLLTNLPGPQGKIQMTIAEKP
jgi:tRNA U34 5-methylaminomethyl-2-thiouridine-forming methyltransferase MnmC